MVFLEVKKFSRPNFDFRPKYHLNWSWDGGKCLLKFENRFKNAHFSPPKLNNPENG